ncbi:thiamine phosphate synthase [Pontibacter sp. G13]|uniref:thiamine phosphate synthase n=1 Tax=Pontibacter sp. G13 TaxID=3074898 RepID=UPI00288B5DAB|nr:thiamine phosphate synthase [Pontibacter sp. G13]WNJ18967.1 thiamine phosphate synthase [Pontibacter sp. G13]
MRSTNSNFILITSPERLEGEAETLQACFEAGLPWLHIRKPTWRRSSVRELIQQIPSKYHSRMVLHHHHKLCNEFSLGGLHVPAWMRKFHGLGQWKDYTKWKSRQDLTISTSVHELDELIVLPHLIDYAFCSPVYESISKVGYRPKVDWRFEKPAALLRIALGGIEASKFEDVRKRGFDGVAIMGAIWEEDDPVSSLQDQLTAWNQQQGHTS